MRHSVRALENGQVASFVYRTTPQTKITEMFLMHRLSVTLQRRNAACILGSLRSSLGLDEICYL